MLDGEKFDEVAERKCAGLRLALRSSFAMAVLSDGSAETKNGSYKQER